MGRPMAQPRHKRTPARSLFRKMTRLVAVIATMALILLPVQSATAGGKGEYFDWNWRYDKPSCTALVVKYPSNIPEGQSNDVNVRIVNLGEGGGEVTLNFHNNTGTWSGTQAFTYAQHPNWPGWDYYKVVWTQVGGTNYHWQGNVTCGEKPKPKEASAIATVSAPTCTEPSKVDFKIQNATWDSDADLSVGTHTRTATADKGAKFPGGANKMTVNYTIKDKLPTQSTDPSAPCYEPPVVIPKDASASVATDTAASCTAVSSVTFDIVNATWDSAADLSVGTHTRTATAADGHEFADGTTKTTVTYTIQPTKPGQSTDPKGECYVPPTPKVCVAFEDGPTATNLNEAGWNHTDTRATGAYEYVDGGIRLHTTDTDNPASSQNKVTLYRPVSPTPLSQFGEPSVEFAVGGSGVKPGMNVGVDVNGDGTWDGYLVGEPWSYGEHNWWVNKPGFNLPAGMGYASFGSWSDFVAANPQAMVVSVGLSLGSGVLGDWTVTSFTVDCTVYTFDNEVVPPPVAEFTAPTVTDVCGMENDGVTLGTSEHGNFKVTSVTPLDDGRIRHRVVFTPSEGYVVPPPGENDTYEIVDGKAVWKLYSTDEPCPPVEVPSNGQYSVQLGCYAVVEGGLVVPSPHVTLTFSNPVDVKKGEVARDAEFTYTDENGATQTVTVPANTVVVRSVVFPEDSGNHIVKVGLKGEQQETVTVQTDCEPNPVPFTPTSPTFMDKCGLVDDRAVLPGTLVSSTSSTDNLTGIIYRTETSETNTGTYYAYYLQDKDTLEVEVWFVPNDSYAVPTEPGPKDTYTIKYGLAV